MFDAATDRLTNVQRRVYTISELAKLAIESKLFSGEIKHILAKYRTKKETVVAAISKGISTGSLEDQARSGRPNKLTEDQLGY